MDNYSELSCIQFTQSTTACWVESKITPKKIPWVHVFMICALQYRGNNSTTNATEKIDKMSGMFSRDHGTSGILLSWQPSSRKSCFRCDAYWRIIKINRLSNLGQGKKKVTYLIYYKKDASRHPLFFYLFWILFSSQFPNSDTSKFFRRLQNTRCPNRQPEFFFFDFLEHPSFILHFVSYIVSPLIFFQSPSLSQTYNFFIKKNKKKQNKHCNV